jgi:predicted nucleic acid-binding Zn ribbon protein
MNRRTPYNQGQWQVSRERFHIEAAEPPAPDAGALPLAALVSDALQNMKLDAHAQVSQIAAAWPEIVGPQLAANTKPAHIENKLLTVFVSHPMWLMELRGAPAAEILARLQGKFGQNVIQNIRWSIDPDPPAR